MSIPTRAEIDALISERIADDPSFRDALLSDPRAALSALVQTEIPEFIAVTVHEESLTDVHLVIPEAPGDEIAEEDLEMVAGGEACWTNSCTSGP